MEKGEQYNIGNHQEFEGACKGQKNCMMVDLRNIWGSSSSSVKMSETA